MGTYHSERHLYRFLRPIEITLWLGILTLIGATLLLPLTSQENCQVWIITGVGAAFSSLLFHWIIPHYGLGPWVRYASILAALGLITAASLIFSPYAIWADGLFIVLVAGVGIISRRTFAIQTAVLAAVCNALVILLLNGLTAPAIISTWLHAMILVFIAYGGSRLSSTVTGQTAQTERKNRHLALLLQVENLTTQTDDIQAMLSHIAETITLGVPVTACRISVLNPARDQLEILGAYPIRPLEDSDVGIGHSYALNTLPCLQEVISGGKPCILFRDEFTPLITETDGPAFFYHGIQVLFLLPLNIQGSCLGILAAGENQSMGGKSFDDDKIHLLQTLSNQVATAIQSAFMLREAQRQAQRLAIANEIGKTITSTIELDALLELLYIQLRKAIPSDTYYVDIYNEGQDYLDMQILIDEGVRYPPAKIPLGNGLASHVLKTRKPLLLHHLSEERGSLPMQPIPVGNNRPSESWLGVPMVASYRTSGILAIASYTPNAFDEDDMMLLTNVAAQAGLAIDNARQHAEVKEQARRDSLTGAYNHGYFLQQLQEAVELNQRIKQPVSLIMLDIDFFKQYNDRYGHKVGDEVLKQLVQAITAHVKKTDIVGRWGGEEFAVGLPRANTEQAFMVAQRIRQTLLEIPIYDKHNHRIPSPTTSQGIATFPLHAADSSTLVDLADEALYRAKHAGRDQVAVAQISSTENEETT